MIWLIAFLTKNAAAIAIIGATAGAIQATEGAIINAVVLEKEIKNALEFVLSGRSQTAASKLFGVSSSHLSHLLSGDRQQNWQRRIS